MRTILIEKIDFVEVESDRTITIPYSLENVGDSNYHVSARKSKVSSTETIRPTKIVKADGTVINIGLSLQAQETIGVYFDAWHEKEKFIEDMSYSLEKSLHRAKLTENKLNKIYDASLWQRILNIFMKYKAEVKL